ncbi:purine-nucleoside phosphorylase [Candidatus Uhrbacteria bacterium]|nr:purine-nucleoside phosphorylase [Candidatus Uhrbacteria bacterium]MBT7717344.1 purine-nucleoside phosphorylase [Candidatus Uhrbacteria bacterium]
MSIHIGAEKGQIASIVLMPGDPIRAHFIAEYLFGQGVEPVHNVRANPCFTGRVTRDGVELEVSVQASGMGMPTLGIYATELYDEFGVKIIIRVGTFGIMQADLKPRDLALAQCASTDASFISLEFGGRNFAPGANPELLFNAQLAARDKGWKVRAGNILSSDYFYHKRDPDAWKLWQSYGVLGVEMEAARLYTLAAEREGCRALAVLTASDHLETNEQMSADERATCFPRMVELALASAIPLYR